MKHKKDKKRKRSRKPAAAKQTRGPHFAQPPWAHLAPEERKEFGAALREHATRDRERALAAVEDLTKRVEPFLCLAVLASYTLTAFVSTGSMRQNSSRVTQAHVEFLQAMFLRQALEQSIGIATPDDITVAWEALPQLFTAHQFAGSYGDKFPESADGRALVMVQEYLRAHTSVVRNWGYFGSVLSISRALFAPLDPAFKVHYGLSLSDLLRIFEHLVRRQEDEVSSHWKTVQEVFAASTIQQLVDGFFLRFPFGGDAVEIARDLKQNAGTHEQARYALLPLADRYLVACVFQRSWTPVAG